MNEILLERIIDEVGLSRTLELIAQICNEKARELEDKLISADWDIAGTVICGIANHDSVREVSLI